MRVKTKYGLGTLLGMTVLNVLGKDEFGYKVLLDNIFPSEIFPEEERIFNEVRDVERRIYHCSYITILTDDGKEIRLDRHKFIPAGTQLRELPDRIVLTEDELKEKMKLAFDAAREELEYHEMNVKEQLAMACGGEPLPKYQTFEDYLKATN